ncbi:MipA/OmpV family protein [Colwellia sp. 75C3]|uniref:MipA/OmpV family protein n=1 Tax=Colwellia sp. 75C3 TaxID=888425 RepID=UPI0012FF3BFC|nr:MipA/OmpV family protein [Colwellia sp. 75C3]
MKKLFIPLVLATVSVSSFADEKVVSATNDIGSLPQELVGPSAAFNNKEGWRYAAGIGLEYEALYHGSDETEMELTPYVEIAFSKDNWEFQTNIFNNRFIYQGSETLFYTGWINLEDGRDEESSEEGILDGMGEIDDQIEIGGGISWQPVDKLTISLVGQGYAGGDTDKGYVGFLSAHYRIIEQANFVFEVGADISFGNSQHLTSEFGVSKQQSIDSGYSEYAIDGGLKSYGLSANGTYLIRENMSVAFGVHYEVYTSDISDSPLIKVGADSEIEAELTFIYQF